MGGGGYVAFGFSSRRVACSVPPFGRHVFSSVFLRAPTLPVASVVRFVVTSVAQRVQHLSRRAVGALHPSGERQPRELAHLLLVMHRVGSRVLALGGARLALVAVIAHDLRLEGAPFRRLVERVKLPLAFQLAYPGRERPVRRHVRFRSPRFKA